MQIPDQLRYQELTQTPEDATPEDAVMSFVIKNFPKAVTPVSIETQGGKQKTVLVTKLPSQIFLPINQVSKNPEIVLEFLFTSNGIYRISRGADRPKDDLATLDLQHLLRTLVQYRATGIRKNDVIEINSVGTEITLPLERISLSDDIAMNNLGYNLQIIQAAIEKQEKAQSSVNVPEILKILERYVSPQS